MQLTLKLKPKPTQRNKLKPSHANASFAQAASALSVDKAKLLKVTLPMVAHVGKRDVIGASHLNN